MRLARLGTLSLLFLLLLPACDGGGVGREDSDAATPLSPIDGGLAADGAIDAGRGLGEERRGVPGTCYDGVDNDADGQTDCADEDCADDPVCCVANAACCAEARTSASFDAPAACDGDFAACGGLDPALVPFGAISPSFEDGGLVPGGGASYGGVALGPALDPRAVNVVVRAEVEIPSAPCTACIDAAGIGLLDAVPVDGQRVGIRVGVLANAGRGELQVLIADRVIHAESLGAAGVRSLAITLTIDGRATIEGLTDARTLEVALPSALVPAVIGRTDEVPAGAATVRVREASAAFEACDVPAALGRATQPVLPNGASGFRPTSLGRVAVLDTPERRLVVFAHDRALYVASPDAAGRLVGADGAPDLLLTAPEGYEALHDPWLLLHGERVVVYFAGERPDGKLEVLRAEGGPDRSLVLATPAPVVLPVEVDSADGPTVWVEDLAAGRWRMIARVGTGEHARLAELVSMDGGGRFLWARGELASSTVRAPSGDAFALDRDEVAEPALVRVGDTWRVYYAGRSGQRWSIGLLVSEEGSAWRDLGLVLAGDRSGFDALGARAPAPWLDDDGAVRLYYVGTGGDEGAIGLAGPRGTYGE
ncbi:MAG: hypothetical protein KF729_24955 [Sandaracinaceae bacterium]|nr:hypothetical protein [Sandaracinaceae bacterium]